MHKKIIFSIVALSVAVIGGGFFFMKGGIDDLRADETASWYAVHLNNGQVYFGHMSRASHDFITLNEAHYVETYQAADTTVSQGKNFAVQQVPKQVYRLVEQGSEKTLATDHTIYINRSAILFWEKLSADADIVNSIKAAGGQNTESRI
ncbi:MAG: hypothetical protein HZB12_01655 [Candidatus Yonathbacteria bacterium]|nr:hypothetical protein [Candidatus Yonathbacteria bacterium]